jgi:hypothetical protein
MTMQTRPDSKSGRIIDTFTRSGSVNVAAFLKERGAEPAELRQLARSPSPAVVPVAFYEKNGMAPSCGLLVAVPRATKPRYIDILRADNGSNFPGCVGIPSIRAFRLQGRHYLAIEYLDQDTRDDTYRDFHYVYDDPAQGFVEDKMLNDGVPLSDIRKAADGIKLGKQLVAIASIANDGTLEVEKDLSADINGAGAIRDIRAARTALSQRLGALRNPPTRQ